MEQSDDVKPEKDFIQQAVNKAYEESILRSFKKLNYKRMMQNKKRNEQIKKRKMERQNKRRARR